ncbi:autotransporter outer membrane beta-barrel domain-containing protein [uncultured Oceanisphaera sp.]|uniref:autotransporter family protein n=1 Tax=uncultured Oceanisphaera sp. TaxID=353858 RepID=UPI0026320D7A|nr:autotransporter outer membrane beta-barrel domain-containing protein [uncultured Oceanisphaera sp.]
MTFKKSQLAMAVAMAVSMSTPALAVTDTNAGIITLEGTGAITIGNQPQSDVSHTETVTVGNETYIETSSLFRNSLASDLNGDTLNNPFSDGALYYSKDSSLLELKEADLSRIDLDLRDANSDDNIGPTEEFLTVGNKSTFVFDDVNATNTIIETNGAHIEHDDTPASTPNASTADASAATIKISNSTLTGVEFDDPEESYDPIWAGSKEMLTNNGGEIVSMGLGNAIDISNNSTINGLIINEDWSDSEDPMKGGFIVATKGAGISLTDSTLNGGIHNVSRQDAAKIVGGRAAIELNNSTLNGYIVNEHSGENQPVGSQPIILGKDVAIAFNNSQINGGIKNEGIIVAEGTAWYDEATGNSTDEQFDTLLDSKLNGDTPFDAQGNAAIQLKDGTVFNGNIDNSGRIAGLYGIALYNSTPESKANNYTGNINNTGKIVGKSTGISLGNTHFNGEINNSGTINGGTNFDHHYGIDITDSVTGKIVINQIAGELIGKTALKMNNITTTNLTGGAIKGNVVNNGGSFNYKGGSIAGNVANHGGTFYVEGNRSIAGDYMQTAGSTLAMGLHKQTSLTADNIDLKAGSRVLIDLTKGDLYVQNGTKVEILKANGTLTNADVDYVVNSKLVTAKAERNAAGNLELTFERGSYNETIKEDLKKNVGGISSTKAKNLNGLTNVFDKLDRLPNTPVVEKLKLMIQKSFSNNSDSVGALNEYLPDTSGASVAGAMNASSQSGTQISVRARGLASGDAFANSGLWIQGLVSNGKQDNRYGDGYDADSSGFVLGADTELNSGLVLGAAYSFINSQSDTANSSTDSDYHMATAYAAQALGQVLLDGQAYYAWGDNDSHRTLTNGGASANYDSSLVGARVGAGYQFELGQATRFVPSLSLEASRLSVDGYTENGSPAALTIGSQDFDRLELGLSTELSKDYQLTHAMVTPSLTLGAFRDFKAEAQGSTVAFAAAPAETFTITGRDPEKNRYVAGVGLDIMSGENLTVSAEYNYNWNGDGFDANAGALKFRWDF